MIPRELSKRESRLIALAVVMLAAGLATRLRTPSVAPATTGTRATEAKGEDLPQIDLARLDAAPPESRAGRRDIFEFGRPPVVEAPPTPPPTPIPLADLAPTPPPVPQLAPLNLKFIGSLDNSRGTKVAVLVTDKNELLTGQVGEVVANRYRIGKIGFESVDLEDVTSGQTRRIALRAK